MQIRAKVTGDREVIRNIRNAYRSVGGAFLDKTMKEGLAPMKAETEQNARPLRDYAGKYPGFPDPVSPRKGGHLDQGVAIRKKENKGQYEKTYWVGFVKRGQKLAHLVEFGTAPHFQPNFKGGFQHPGASPHPFFRPAFESTKQDVVDDISEKFWLQIRNSVIKGFR